MQNLTPERLRELLSYDKQTGVFIRIVDIGPWRAGQVMGSVASDGYIQIAVDGYVYKAHRLAWLYEYGSFPKGHIDHINGVRSDNRIINLRDVSRAVNNQNLRRATKANKSSGRLGVSWHKTNNKWNAQISVKGRKIHLGYFDDPDEAHAAYVAAKREMHPGCTL